MNNNIYTALWKYEWRVLLEHLPSCARVRKVYVEMTIEDTKSHLCLCPWWYSWTEIRASKMRRFFKDSGNVTEAKLTMSLLVLLLLWYWILEGRKAPAPDLIRVDDDKRTYASRLRRRRTRNTALPRPRRRSGRAEPSCRRSRLQRVTAAAAAAAKGHAVFPVGPRRRATSSSSSTLWFLDVLQRAPAGHVCCSWLLKLDDDGDLTA